MKRPVFLNSFFPCCFWIHFSLKVGPDSKLKFSGVRTRHTTTLEIFLDQKGLRGRKPRRATQCCQPAAKSREGALREHSPGKTGSVLFLALCLVDPAFYLVNLSIGTHAGFLICCFSPTHHDGQQRQEKTDMLHPLTIYLAGVWKQLFSWNFVPTEKVYGVQVTGCTSKWLDAYYFTYGSAFLVRSWSWSLLWKLQGSRRSGSILHNFGVCKFTTH